MWREWTPEVPFDVDPRSPRLVAPAAGAFVDNGCTGHDEDLTWDFEWSACRGADRYHLMVTGPSAAIPVVDDDRLRDTSYAHRSRALTLEWAPAPRAVSYTVEIESCVDPACASRPNPYQPVAGVTGFSHTFAFVGAQPGRWRVFAVDGDGAASPRSPWRYFRFTR